MISLASNRLLRIGMIPLVCVALLLTIVGSAYAAAPVCYSGETQSTVRVQDCAKGLYPSAFGHAPKADFCYFIGGMTVREFGISEVLPATDPMKGWECGELAKFAGAGAGKPAECYSFNADTLATYFSLEYKPDQIAKIPCTPELAARIKAKNAGFVDFQTSACYLFSKNDDTSPLCSNLATFNKTAAENQQRDEKKAEEAQQKAAGAGAGSSSFGTQGCKGDACLKDNELVKLILAAINLLSIAIGVIVVIVITIGGIQYSSAGGNPNAVGAAKKRIINAIMALVMYVFLWAFLQWLVPGGILRP